MLTAFRWRMAACAGIALTAVSGMAGSANAAKQSPRAPEFCMQFQLDIKPSVPLQQISVPPAQKCQLGISNGYSIPDAMCTPGAINLNLTPYVLRNPAFRTSCIRRRASVAARKLSYEWYSLPQPGSAPAVSCMLDRLIPIELGGADRIDNLWPMCGPPGAGLDTAYFKAKDIVESYLVREFKEGKIDLEAAQHGIAADWTQYLAAAKAECGEDRC
jgi:hypothetical protein